jgi:hypothetical protein
VVEAAGRSRLGDELSQALGIRVGTLVKDLEGHFAMEAWIPGAIHQSHAAAAERRADLIRREACVAGDPDGHIRGRAAILHPFAGAVRRYGRGRSGRAKSGVHAP